VILVAPERVHAQLGQHTGRAMQEFTSLQDLLQKQRVGVVDHRDVHVASGAEALQVGAERDDARE